MDASGIIPGLHAQKTITVTDSDTAIALGSGSVPVLATPRVVALVEAAAVAAVSGHVADAMTTVGTRIALDHVAASPVGSEVAAHAEVVAVDGRRISYRVWASMGAREVAHGEHIRVMVPADGFGR